MRSFTILAALIGAASAGPSLAASAGDDISIVHPGGVGDIVLTDKNTLNGTYHDAETKVVQNKVSVRTTAQKPNTLSLKFVNRLGSQLNAYITGLDKDGKVVFARADGSLVYPSSGESSTPVVINEELSVPLGSKGKVLCMSVEVPITSGRLYVAQSELKFFMVKPAESNKDTLVHPSEANLKDPNAGIKYDFIEFNLQKDGFLGAAINHDDFIGLPLSIRVTGSETKTVRSLRGDCVDNLCNAERGGLQGIKCVADENKQDLRVLLPRPFINQNPAVFKEHCQFGDESGAGNAVVTNARKMAIYVGAPPA